MPTIRIDRIEIELSGIDADTAREAAGLLGTAISRRLGSAGVDAIAAPAATPRSAPQLADHVAAQVVTRIAAARRARKGGR